MMVCDCYRIDSFSATCTYERRRVSLSIIVSDARRTVPLRVAWRMNLEIAPMKMCPTIHRFTHGCKIRPCVDRRQRPRS